MDKKEFNALKKDFKTNEKTLLYGITPRLGSHLAERFRNLLTLETCSGAGFLTIELAKVAKKVITFDINPDSINQAKHNAHIADVDKLIDFIHGDILDESLLTSIQEVDAAILDPVWNDRILSHMSPPADLLFETIKRITENIALILPPEAENSAKKLFPQHELERLYLDGELALVCLYFGSLARCKESIFEA